MAQTEPLLRSVYSEVTGREAGGTVWDELAADSLAAEDARILYETAALLGRSDAETQRSQLNEAVARLQRRLQEEREKRPAAERLCLTLGTMLGLCLVILLL